MLTEKQDRVSHPNSPARAQGRWRRGGPEQPWQPDEPEIERKLNYIAIGSRTFATRHMERCIGLALTNCCFSWPSTQFSPRFQHQIEQGGGVRHICQPIREVKRNESFVWMDHVRTARCKSAHVNMLVCPQTSLRTYNKCNLHPTIFPQASTPLQNYNHKD